MMHPAVLMTLYKRVRTKDCFYVCYRLLLVMFFMVSERVQFISRFYRFHSEQLSKTVTKFPQNAT